MRRYKEVTNQSIIDRINGANSVIRYMADILCFTGTQKSKAVTKYKLELMDILLGLAKYYNGVSKKWIIKNYFGLY